MKKIKLSVLSVLLFFVLSSNTKKEFQNSPKALKGKITISGAFALYPLAVRWGEEFKKLHPEVSFDIQGGGAGKGMTDVLSGTVDLAMLSRDVKKEETDKGARLFGVGKDAVVATYNPNNPFSKLILTKGVSKEEFAGIWVTKTIKTWGVLLGTTDKTEINPFTRSDAAGAAESWAKYLGAKAQEDLKGIGVFGDPGLLGAVIKDKYAVGYNNIGFAYNLKTKKLNPGVGVIPIDLNGNNIIDTNEKVYDNLNTIMKAIANGTYPAPPARQLYFVSKNKPNALTNAFLNWVLNEGQKYVNEMGYVKLNSTDLGKSKTNLILK